jgi:WD40 repeat protein
MYSTAMTNQETLKMRIKLIKRVRRAMLGLAAVTVMAMSSFAQTPGTWTATNQLANSTENPTSTLLQNGKVLVTGGDLGTIILTIRNAQLYDPAKNSWSATGKMTAKRGYHSATLLPNGQVLVSGGTNGNIGANGYDLTILKSTELYDPGTGNFVATAKMAVARMNHTSTLLPNGKILVTGGINAAKPRLRWAAPTNTAEIFDPATGTWSSAGTMNALRAYHSATVLPSGKVLVVGTGSADLYDPNSNTWTSTGPPISKSTASPAVLLQNGKVLFANPLGTAELYDPNTGAFTQTGAMATQHSGGMVLLGNGKALIVGSYATGTCELFDPLTGTWSFTGSLNSYRTNAPVTLLSDGKVLITGGAPVWWNGEVYTQ